MMAYRSSLSRRHRAPIIALFTMATMISAVLAAASPLDDAAATAPAPVASVATDERAISFKDDVLPGLIFNCGYCHQSYDRHGFLVFDSADTYASLVNVPAYQLPSMMRIAPGRPEASYLWLKGTGQHVAAGGSGWEMPVMIGLRSPFKETLLQWIEQGAQNN